MVGSLLIVYLIGVAIQIATRAASNSRQASFVESMTMIAENQGWYLTSMYANIVSNVLLVGLAVGLFLLFRRHQAILAAGGAFLLLATAAVSMVPGLVGLELASLAREYQTATGPQGAEIASRVFSNESLQELAGQAGFTLAALSVMTIGALIAWRRPLPRWLGWLGILVGVMMFFIWSDSAPLLHRIGGTGYLLWLGIAGGWLLIRGTRKVATE